jgi:hypothetical protein
MTLKGYSKNRDIFQFLFYFWISAHEKFKGAFIVIIPYMSAVYLEQVHLIHYFPISSSLLSLFSRSAKTQI